MTTLSIDSLTTNPSGSENGLVVRNIPSGTQKISIDGYVPTQDLKDISRVIKTFTATNVLGTNNSETMVTLTPATDFVTSSSGTSFGVTSGKKLRIQSFTVSDSANLNATSIRLRISNSGAVTTSTLVVVCLDSAGSNTIFFPDGLELSGSMQFGVSQLRVDGSPGGVKLDVSIIGYEY